MLLIGIGDWVNGMELTMVASHPYEQNYIQVDSFQALNDELRLTLTDLICNSKFRKFCLHQSYSFRAICKFTNGPDACCNHPN